MKRFLLAAALLALCACNRVDAQEAPSVSISVTPQSGLERVTPKVTWTSTGVQACNASGGWSGSKAVNGTETLPEIMQNASYVLVCTTAGGDIVVSWTPPTQNTNNTPLTDLAGFKIYVGTSVSTVQQAAPVILNNPSANTHTLKNVAKGVKYVAVTAFNSAGAESALSNTPSKDVKEGTAQASASVAVTPVPKAVGAVTLQ